MGIYFESFRVEAREQLRLVFAYRLHKNDDYVTNLQYQANPPDAYADADIGTEGIEKLMGMFGHEVKADTGKIIERKKHG